MWVLSAGCKALLSVLLSTPSGLAYVVQQQEGSQSLISALQNRYANIKLERFVLCLAVVTVFCKSNSTLRLRTQFDW